jgi:hypothetical protein
MIFITQFLKSNINYIEPQGQWSPARKNSECTPDKRYEIQWNIRCDEYMNKMEREAAFKNLI